VNPGTVQQSVWFHGDIKQRVADLGWVEGRNVVWDGRYADGQLERVPELMRELVASQPDVIFTYSGLTARAAMAATRTIPIVTVSADPIAAGYAQTLARPGGNVTGFVSFGSQVGPKLLEFLRAALPRLERLAVLADPSSRGSRFENEFLAAAQAMNLQVVDLRAQSATEIEQAFARVSRERVDALAVIPSTVLATQRLLIAELSRNLRVPMGLFGYAIPEWGALLSYQASTAEAHRMVARYIDRMLKGENPAETPFEHSSRFELTINLRVARELGITIPPLLLLRADEAIE
jgi:putative ABC transport system substrate-binding protein